MAIKTRHDRLPFQTGIHTEHLYPASQTAVAIIITFGPQPNKAIVGENAFAHEAGIHQDGYLKEKSTYEIIDPTSRRRARRQAGAGQAQRPPRAEAARARIWASSSRKRNWTLVYDRFTALADTQEGPAERRDR